MRGQTTLPGLGIAFLVLTGVLVFGIVTADAALRGADRAALDRKAAVGVSDALVRAESPLTDRANVVNATRVAGLTVSGLRESYGLPADVSVRVTLDGRRLVSTGSPSGGVTVERIVLVERRDNRTLKPAFEGTRTVTLPRRTPRIALVLDPPVNTTLRTVRVNGRVRLHNTSGLNGTYEIPVSTVETARLHFDAVGPLSEGSVRVRYYPSRTEKARLGVTVDG